MDIQTEFFTVIAIVLTIMAYGPYIRDTYIGKTRPHVFTFLIAGILSFILFFIQMEKGGGAGSYVTLLMAILSWIILLLSIKNGRRDIKTSDYIFLCLSVLAIPLWLVVGKILFSTIILCSISILSFLPTARKAWKEPHSETFTLYVIGIARNIVAIAALSEKNFITVLPNSTFLMISVYMTLSIPYRKKYL